MKWGNIKPIVKSGKVVAAKIIVYAGEEDEYFSFISKEAFQFLKEWMSYRELSGVDRRKQYGNARYMGHRLLKRVCDKA
jgi:hypothetical protein